MKRELSSPPSGSVAWLVRVPDGRAAHVAAQTWFDAREQGARIFGVPAEQVTATQRSA